MPTYQYACTNPECANRFELVQSFTDPAATECPVCASAVRKVYGAVGVVFKGSGFYRTDSRAGEKSKSSSSSSSEKSGSSSEKSGDSSSTTTPAPAATFSSGPDKSAPSTSTGAGKSGKAAASA
jgi:putative FmdB family regulatory protein